MPFRQVPATHHHPSLHIRTRFGNTIGYTTHILVGATTALLVVGPSRLLQMVRGGTLAPQITPAPPTSQAPTPPPALPTPTAQLFPTPEQQAQSVIDHYYTAINSKDYQTAYNLWLNYPDTYQNFANGFANTSYDSYTFGNTVQQSDGTVQVDLTIIATSTASANNLPGILYRSTAIRWDMEDHLG